MKRLILVACLFLAGVAGQFALLRARAAASPVAADGVIAALGGFRSLAAEAD